ncbi:MAG: transglycosylase domain-containing protein [Caldilineaceae bacterium]|nr:transglycosylase domain-containing protein [Caldilineaceae bacterium]
MSQYELIPRDSGASRPPRRSPRGRSPFVRGLFIGGLSFVILSMFAAGMLLIGYAIVASSLPASSRLTEQTSKFQTTRILDRNGNLLNETFDPDNPEAGRRTIVTLGEITPALTQATIATEDANFYRHQGVDPVALTRALYYAVREGDVVSGASTISQQLVKMVMLTPEYTLTRKVKEAILSAEITRRYSKDEILEIYLNEIYYGNLAYGAAAAAETYFGKAAHDLSLAEAALLAGLPQLPAYYDPYTQPERAKKRQGVVLGLMVEHGDITPEEADAAWLEPLAFVPVEFNLDAPHFTLLVRQQLEEILGKEALYSNALQVTTSLDPDLQAAAERIVAEQVALLADRHVSNGALVAMEPATGQVLAFVGSADFNNVEIDGQVNMALAPRQPGSSIKPFVYLAAFEQSDKPPAQRWTPGTLVADIEEEFPDGANPPYVPTNYDGSEHGMVSVRTGLANSYNIPAVRALEAVGVQPFVARMADFGVTTLTRPDYGLSLSLGAGEIPLLELTGAFGVLANGGVRVPPVTILEIKNHSGDILCAQASDRPCQPKAGEQVVAPADAFLITDILSDNEARSPAFGPNSVLRLDRPAAVKTGTTNDIRDNLTVGYTPQLVTGVWVGNADNSPMVNVSGVSGAGPIWHEFMTAALANQPLLAFEPPAGVTRFEVCADTGTAPSDVCPEKRERFFAQDRPPLPSEQDLWQRVRLDRTTGQYATEFTPPGDVEERVFKVYPDAYRTWAEEHGIPQPPPGYQRPTAQPSRQPNQPGDEAVQAVIREPVDGQAVSGVVTVWGSARIPDFAVYELQYGISHDPGAFSPPIAGPYNVPVTDGILGQWDVRNLDDGPHTLRLLVWAQSGRAYETRVRVFVDNPAEPTTPPTIAPATPTWTPAPAFTATPLPTLEPTWTPLPSVTPTWTPLPTEPAPEATPTWTPLPSEPPPVTGGQTITGAGMITDTFIVTP